MPSDHEVPALFPHVPTMHRAAQEEMGNLMRDYKPGH